MPLSFESVNFGNIAFGFFNIKTDLILLEQHFFFASDFCNCISKLAKIGNVQSFNFVINGYFIPYEKIGDLMGAIHKIKYIGFIGEVYKIFPFPDNLKDFKQDPEGFKNREVVENLIKNFGVKEDIKIIPLNSSGYTLIAEYEFTKESFFELINYVWLGGMPRWKGNKRPDYVLKMKEDILNSKNEFFKGISFLNG